MRNFKTFLIGAVVIAALGSVYAQPAGEQPGVDLGGSAEVQSNLSPQEMNLKAESLLREMQSDLDRLQSLQESARRERDVIKLNCVNDKLLQVKQLMNIADAARSFLGQAIASQNDGDRYHQFSMVTVAAEKANTLSDDAQACIGQNLVFRGQGAVHVDAPVIIDDPTARDPFSLGGFELERPTYATPYL